MLEKPWAYGVDPNKHPCYQPIEDYTYWPMSVYINNCNTNKFTNRSTSIEDCDVVHKVLIESISDNMALLVQLGKYGSINAVDTTTMDQYVIKLLYKPYTLQ